MKSFQTSLIKAMDENISISVNNLSKNYGKVSAIKNADFQIKKGEIVGLLGPNGAGKSTTMRILGGLLRADSGSATVCGLSVADNSLAIKRKIGFMQENNPLPEDLRVMEYLKLRAELKEVDSKKLSTEVRRVMDLCDLFRTARRKIIRSLSKGFKQRVGIADALIGSPEIIILDEPTIGLDPHQIQGIRKLIDSLRGKYTVLISSHILSEIERNCDRVIIINHGRVVAMGTKPELSEEFIKENHLRLQVSGNIESLITRLKSAKEDYEIKEEQSEQNDYSTIVIKSTEALDISDYTEIVNQISHCQLKGINLIKPDLEAIFLAATKRSWEEIRIKS
ncbi:MAG: ABC transporter ATP-binding protein [Opitutae bacterium]|jgi:ABC-2 type transport system ATP-binding protein|nr:ABC transporter ATP-binding protein [Opitutae bacterium]